MVFVCQFEGCVDTEKVLDIDLLKINAFKKVHQNSVQIKFVFGRIVRPKLKQKSSTNLSKQFFNEKFKSHAKHHKKFSQNFYWGSHSSNIFFFTISLNGTKNNPLIVGKSWHYSSVENVQKCSYQMECLVKLKNRIMFLKSLDDSTSFALSVDTLKKSPFFGNKKNENSEFVVLL